jgi:Type IIA topoisomerase (DNA gyrase/topo II, topoisomerase IV), B subunit
MNNTADIDGHKITSLMGGYFLFHMPQLVEAGKIYKLIPPLYKVVKRGKTLYFNDTRSYSDYIRQDIVANYEILAVGKNGKSFKLSDDELIDKIIEVKDYFRELKKRADKTLMDIELFETILINIYYIIEGKVDKFRQAIKQKARFIEVTNNEKKKEIIVTGYYKMEAQFLRIDMNFLQKASKLLGYLDENPYYFIANGRQIQLCELAQLFNSYEPDDVKRYKGLGEMTASQLAETCIEPGKRNLVRLTMDDLHKSLAQFEVLHGDKQTNRDARKQFMSKFKINIEDVDS